MDNTNNYNDGSYLDNEINTTNIGVDNTKPEDYGWPNDISGIEPIDNHDDGPEPEAKELYLDNDELFANHKPPTDPPTPKPIPIEIEGYDEEMERLKKEKEKEPGLNLPPREYQDIAKEKEYYQSLKEKLQNGLQETEEKEVVSMHM